MTYLDRVCPWNLPLRSNQPAMEGEVLEPSHEVREAYREGFERWQHYGSLLFAQGGTAV